MMAEGAPDDLVTVVSTATPFEAHTLASVLQDAGVDAVVMGATPWAGVPLDQSSRATVQVRREVAERARLVLEANVSDSIDIDWDEIDVGEREDTLPLTPVGRKQMPARVALRVVMVMAVAMLIAGVTMLVQDILTSV